MKKCVFGLIIILFFSNSSFAQTQEAKQLLLDVEKLAQLKNILTDLKKGYEIVSNGYTTIEHISEGNYNMHDLFLSRLLKISPVVKNYKRVADIISMQLEIVSEYKNALRQFKASGQLNLDEINYVQRVYSNLFNQSVHNLEALASVVTAGKLRMSDDERLDAIDGIWKQVSDQLTFLRHFNNETKILALQRAKEQHDVSTMNQLYNVNK